MNPARAASGTHLIADLHGVDAGLLTDAEQIQALLEKAALAAGATIVYSHFHGFGPGQGITGVVLLAESHISIHTWPEYAFAAVDIFMCGEAKPHRALELIVAAFKPAKHEFKCIARGK